MTSPDVIVIGGGLHGCSTALHLRRRGVRTLLIEKDHVGRHASGVNAGGVRRLGRHPAEIPLSVASMEMWHRIADLVDDDCGFDSHGQVKVAESEPELDSLRERVEQVRALGYEHEELVDRAALRELVPSIAPHCVGGIVCRLDGAALPYRTTLAFRRAAEALGGTFVEGEAVRRITRVGGAWRVETDRAHYYAGAIVNAAGAWGHRIAAIVGDDAPLEVIAPMLLITEPLGPFLLPVVGAAGRTLSFKQFANGTVLIGGGHRGRADPERNETELDWHRLSVNVQAVHDLFPLMRPVRIVRAWAGIEGRMPDDIPVIGPSAAAEGVWHQFGFSAHGFQLGPIVGRIVAELIVDGRTSLPIDAFSVTRFRRAPSRSGS